jgi:hypothetical protein
MQNLTSADQDHTPKIGLFAHTTHSHQRPTAEPTESRKASFLRHTFRPQNPHTRGAPDEQLPLPVPVVQPKTPSFPHASSLPVYSQYVHRGSMASLKSFISYSKTPKTKRQRSHPKQRDWERWKRTRHLTDPQNCQAFFPTTSTTVSCIKHQTTKRHKQKQNKTKQKPSNTQLGNRLQTESGGL